MKRKISHQGLKHYLTQAFIRFSSFDLLKIISVQKLIYHVLPYLNLNLLELDEIMLQNKSSQQPDKLKEKKIRIYNINIVFYIIHSIALLLKRCYIDTLFYLTFCVYRIKTTGKK